MIPNTQTFVQALSNGVNTVYSYPNKIDLASDLVITAIDPSLNQYYFAFQSGAVFSNLTLGITATVNGVDVDTGCTVTLSGPLIANWTLDVRSLIPETQPTSIKNQGQFLPDLHEEAFDRVTRQVQDLNRRTYIFGIHGPDSENTPWPALPSAVARANSGLIFDSNGFPGIGVLLPGTFTQTQFNGFLTTSGLNLITAAESLIVGITINTLYPPGNMLRYGLVPNNAGAAGANTAIAKALWNPTITNGPQGQFYFPNTTGADIYSFNGVIPMRYGCYIDLGGCTLDYAATVLAADTNSGLFLALSDFALRNGTITVECNVSAATGAGHAVFIGGRDVGAYFTVFDSLLPRSLGRVVLQNLVIRINNTGTNVASSGGIEMLGGIRDLVAENISINLNSTTPYGIIYEYGWATNETLVANRQTSHAHNMVFRNIEVVGVGNQDAGGTGAGLALGGAYNCLVDGLYVNSAPSIFVFYPGEALFYRPWVGVDDVGAKHNIALRNIVGDSITGTGVSFGGASSAAGGYLAATIAALGHPADYIAQTDLMTFSLDGGIIQAGGVGINVSGPCDIRNVTCNGTAGSGQLVVDDECTIGTFTNCKFLNSSSTGVRMVFPAYGGASDIWNPARQKQLIFDNCIVAGNAVNGYIAANTRSVVIRGGRIGYSVAYDGFDETTQTNCINVSGASGGDGVTAERVYCTPVTGSGGFSYVTTGTTSGNNIVDPLGVVSLSGIWNLNSVVQASSTVFGQASSQVNTTPDKYAGKLGNDTSNHRLLIAQGPNPTDQWIPMTPTTPITPS